ncbi:hypothetical protein [Brevundimonas sp. FT23028]|uniref:hypothetical protein n=1 Tax=Brevundimonas sp. FT23028 TaxID=3393748 RepID=UPI003B588487
MIAARDGLKLAPANREDDVVRPGIVMVVAALAVSGCEPASDSPAPPSSTGPATAGEAAPSAAVEPVAAPRAALGVAFDPGPGLTVSPCEGDMPQCVVVSDPSAEPYMRELLTVQVKAASLEAVAADDLGYRRNADGQLMTTYGRFEPNPVEAFTVNGHPGLRATTTCGISEPDTGFHAGAGDCISAVISDGSRSVIIESSGYGNAIGPANAAIGSLRFPPRP